MNEFKNKYVEVTTPMDKIRGRVTNCGACFLEVDGRTILNCEILSIEVL